MALDRTIVAHTSAAKSRGLRANALWMALGIAALIIAPYFVYPLFLVKLLCMALFAIAFNLLIGYVGLLSFGHALFFGWASYISAHAAKVWGLPPELAILSGAAAAAGLSAAAPGLPAAAPRLPAAATGLSALSGALIPHCHAGIAAGHSVSPVARPDRGRLHHHTGRHG